MTIKKNRKESPGRGSGAKSMPNRAYKAEINELKRAFAYNLFYNQGKPLENASINDYYMAVAYTVRDKMQHLFINSVEGLLETPSKIVCYLSAEFLVGPHLHNNLVCLGLYEQVTQALSEMGLDINEIINHEVEPGLGNGGLGRLAACYMDSLATLQIPAIGYGIRYEHGMFHQVIENGWQKELSDMWLHHGNPWEIKKPDICYGIGFGGHTESYTDNDGKLRMRWVPARMVNAVAYDTPIPGYRVNSVNLLRLWSAEAVDSFDFEDFNVGDYFGAIEEKVKAENISKVLYPNDEQCAGKQLRLEQQFFFVSASLQDMIRIHLIKHDNLDSLPEGFAAQLNDTHPAVAVPELMRLLMDEHGYGWDQAWHITTKTLSYTNHTLLPEALEKWPLPLFGHLLPRHLEIIFEINRRFLEEVKERWPNDEARIERMSIIEETGHKFIRMANLACIGTHAINGVASIHTDLLKAHTLRDFNEYWPRKIKNVTNGVTPRRWMVVSNPRLAALITEAIGEGWIKNLDELKGLEKFAQDPSFREQWRKVQKANKQDVAYKAAQRDIKIDPESMFDVQVKRIHEYKRQHLNVLHIITLYNRIKNDPDIDIIPRSFVFGGKAAPGYFMAKLIIKLINSVADVVNNDPDVRDRLKVFFIPNYNVKVGHTVYPMADLSEQISLAGKEASGTGNMKFSMNGALTIGTLDGANVEIRKEVGPDNFFLFGMTVDEVMARKAAGYNPREFYDTDEELRQALDLIASGHFSKDNTQLFQPVVNSLLHHDEYMLLADYRSYIDCQDKVGESYRDQELWTRMSILNTARMGKFSSDRSIKEYSNKIWGAKPFFVKLKWEKIPEEGLTFRQ